MNFKNYKHEYLMKDIISGIIVALISIPISMGYSRISRASCSIWSLWFAFSCNSVLDLSLHHHSLYLVLMRLLRHLSAEQFTALGIASGSEETMRVVPVITFVTVLASAFLLSKGGKAC